MCFFGGKKKEVCIFPWISMQKHIQIDACKCIYLMTGQRRILHFYLGYNYYYLQIQCLSFGNVRINSQCRKDHELSVVQMEDFASKFNHQQLIDKILKEFVILKGINQSFSKNQTEFNSAQINQSHHWQGNQLMLQIARSPDNHRITSKPNN